MLDTATHNSVRIDPDVAIVGGGPAGMMCGLLLARLLDKVPVLRRIPGGSSAWECGGSGSVGPPPRISQAG